jgi:hypothetical protein
MGGKTRKLFERCPAGRKQVLLRGLRFALYLYVISAKRRAMEFEHDEGSGYPDRVSEAPPAMAGNDTPRKFPGVRTSLVGDGSSGHRSDPLVQISKSGTGGQDSGAALESCRNPVAVPSRMFQRCRRPSRVYQALQPNVGVRTELAVMPWRGEAGLVLHALEFTTINNAFAPGARTGLG